MITIVGGGQIATKLVQGLIAQGREFKRINARHLLEGDERIPPCDLVVIAVVDYAAPDIVARCDPSQRVLDLGPTYRTARGWTYGMKELPGADEAVKVVQYVANPGCFAQSAILAMRPVLDLFPDDGFVYLDGVGGFSTGGQALSEKHDAGTLPAENMLGLWYTHRHVAEIKFALPLVETVLFKPKIANVEYGIRMCIPLKEERWKVLPVLRSCYQGTNIQVFDDVPKSIAVDTWAGREGAGIWVVEDQDALMLVCCIDNLIRGGVEPALHNIKLMLG